MRLLPLGILVLALAGCAEFRQAGRDVKEGTKEIGHGTRDVGREIGRGSKEAVKDIGAGAREIGREIGQGAREAAKELREAVDEDDAD